MEGDSIYACELGQGICPFCPKGMTVNYKKIKSLTIKSGTMNSDDWSVISTNRLKLREVLEAVDMSGATLENIPNFVFYNLVKQADVKMPEGIVSIGAYAFAGCVSLVDIELPGSIESIIEGAFSKLSSLASISILAHLLLLNTANEQ